MRAIIETVFDIFYLVTVLTVGIRMIRSSKSGSQFKLFPSTLSPVHWHCVPPVWKTTQFLWVWASGSLPSP